MMRSSEPGWAQVGPLDPTGRRGLWQRLPDDATLELCAGREGDDSYVRLSLEKHQRAELMDLLSTSMYVATCWEEKT